MKETKKIYLKDCEIDNEGNIILPPIKEDVSLPKFHSGTYNTTTKTVNARKTNIPTSNNDEHWEGEFIE